MGTGRRRKGFVDATIVGFIWLLMLYFFVGFQSSISSLITPDDGSTNNSDVEKMMTAVTATTVDQKSLTTKDEEGGKIGVAAQTVNVGDAVNVNGQQGNLQHPAVVIAASNDGKNFTVQYDEDGRVETLPSSYIRRSPFHTINPNPVWCPYATCRNSPRCQPCQRRFLIEMATGRSGSTSLMHMLDMLPGLRMAGENNNQLHAIHTMIDNIVTNKNFVYDRKGREPFRPWKHGYISKGDLSCPAQSMIESINAPTKEAQEDPDFDDENTILGFKTIRFLHKNWRTGGSVNDKDMIAAANKADEANGTETLVGISQAVRFLESFFPCSRVVININSNVTRQAQSAFHGNKMTNRHARLQAETELMKKVGALLGERAFVMDLKEWTHPERGVDKINKLIRWLGYRECEFERLLHDNDGGSYRPDDKTEIDLGPNCRYGMGKKQVN